MAGGRHYSSCSIVPGTWGGRFRAWPRGPRYSGPKILWTGGESGVGPSCSLEVGDAMTLADME